MKNIDIIYTFFKDNIEIHFFFLMNLKYKIKNKIIYYIYKGKYIWY